MLWHVPLENHIKDRSNGEASNSSCSAKISDDRSASSLCFSDQSSISNERSSDDDALELPFTGNCAGDHKVHDVRSFISNIIEKRES